MSFAKKMKRKREAAGRKQLRAADRKRQRDIFQSVAKSRHDEKMVIANAKRLGEQTDAYGRVLEAAAAKAFGFGYQRMSRLRRRVFRYCTCMNENYVTIKEVEDGVYEETGFQIRDPKEPPRKPKNIVEGLEFTIQDSIFAGFILALIDEYNMGKKRLTRYIEAAYDLIKEVKDGRMSKAEFTAYYYKHCYKEAAA